MHSYPAYRFFQSQKGRSDFPATAWHLGEISNQAEFVRLIADYIAGMTDSFAMKEYERLGA